MGPPQCGPQSWAPLALLGGPDCFQTPWAGLVEASPASLLKINGTLTLGRLILTATQFCHLKHISQSVLSRVCQLGRCQLQVTGGQFKQV